MIVGSSVAIHETAALRPMSLEEYNDKIAKRKSFHHEIKESNNNNNNNNNDDDFLIDNDPDVDALTGELICDGIGID